MRASGRRPLSLLPALLWLALPLAAQDSAHSRTHEHADPDHAAPAAARCPAGWSVRSDEDAATPNVKAVAMGQGISRHARARHHPVPRQEAGNGPFHTLATFTQTKQRRIAEGYGLFFGGQALDGKDEKYTYFLVRQDGRYLVKRRDGEKTTDVTKGWVASAAVQKPDAKGSATNLLEVDHKRTRARSSSW